MRVYRERQLLTLHIFLDLSRPCSSMSSCLRQSGVWPGVGLRHPRFESSHSVSEFSTCPAAACCAGLSLVARTLPRATSGMAILKVAEGTPEN